MMYNKPMPKRKRRERSLGAATRYGIAATIATGIIIFLVFVAIPNTSLNVFFRLQTSSTPLMPSSELYLNLQNDMDRQEACIWTPICLLIGGLVTGLLAPKTVTIKTLCARATYITLLVFLLAGLVTYGSIFAAQHGHLHGYYFPARIILVQLALLIPWSLACIAGALAGHRMSRRGVPVTPPRQTVSAE